MHEIELHAVQKIPSLTFFWGLLFLFLFSLRQYSCFNTPFVAPQATINNFARQFGNRNNKNIIATLKAKHEEATAQRKIVKRATENKKEKT